MTNSYVYKVTNLVHDSAGIVITAYFSIQVSDGVDNFTHNYAFGFANKPVTPDAFNALTEDKVIGWIKRDAGTDNGFEKSADAELAAYKLRKAAPVVSAGTPW